MLLLEKRKKTKKRKIKTALSNTVLKAMLIILQSLDYLSSL